MATFLRIHESAVQSFIEPGGDVYDVVLLVSDFTVQFARTHIHSRTGRLAGSLRRNYPVRSGVFVTTGTVYSPLKYSKWVHEGVQGRIYPKNGKYLAVPKMRGIAKGTDLVGGRGSGPRLYSLVRSVRGQSANPFLERGMRDAMRLIL